MSSRKMDKTKLASAAATYVDATKQTNATYSGNVESLCKMITKIGAQVTLEGFYEDKLEELDSFDLPLGTTIEEHFKNLILPAAFTQGTTASTEDVANYVPQYLNVIYENPAYNYSLGKQRFVATKPMNNFERACINSTVAGNLIADDLDCLQKSRSMWKYAIKKQLLGNAIAKADTLGKVVEVPQISTSDDGEDWILAIKNAVEEATFAHDEVIAKEGSPAVDVKAFIGSTPSLTLYVKKGVLSSLQVRTLAGAFNPQELNLGVKVKIVDDFGNTDLDNYVGILVDDRAIRLHMHDNSVYAEPQYANQQVTTYAFEEYTGFISKFCFMRAIKIAAEE